MAGHALRVSPDHPPYHHWLFHRRHPRSDERSARSRSQRTAL